MKRDVMAGDAALRTATTWDAVGHTWDEAGRTWDQDLGAARPLGRELLTTRPLGPLRGGPDYE